MLKETSSAVLVLASCAMGFVALNRPAHADTAAEQDDTYDYTEAVKQFVLVIPKGLTTVRGILVVSNYSGGDSRDYHTQNWYRVFMNLHGFAFLGSKGDPSHAAAYQVFLRAIKQFSIDSRHPELQNAPYAATGFSAGGGFASTLLTSDPDKTIAVGIVGARYNLTVLPGPPTAAHLGVPGCLITGEQENAATVVDPVFKPYRPQGALYSWMEVQGQGHACYGQQVLAMPLLDAAVRARYPADGDVRKGPITLKRLDPSSGWVADDTTWKSGLTAIAPANQWKGDLGHSSWLQNEDLAFIYRAYATFDNPLSITSPASGMPGGAVDCAPGADVPILVDAGKFPQWNRLVLYDGAKKLGEITQGPTRFTAKKLAPGYHVFSVLGSDPRGNVRSSGPALVVAMPPQR
jgi:hypothetical protein